MIPWIIFGVYLAGYTILMSVLYYYSDETNKVDGVVLGLGLFWPIILLVVLCWTPFMIREGDPIALILGIVAVTGLFILAGGCMIGMSVLIIAGAVLVILNWLYFSFIFLFVRGI
jgi:hypothetical protein